MRVTNEDLGPMPQDYESLKRACEATGIVDVDLVLDMYAVCSVKSSGVDFKEVEEIITRFDKADPQFWQSRMTVDSRIKYLEEFSKSTFVEALIALNDPMKATLTFLDSLDRCAKAQAQKVNLAQPRYDLTINPNGNANVDGQSIEAMAEAEEAASADYSNVDEVNTMLNRLTTYEDIIEDDAASAFLQGGAGADAVWNNQEDDAEEVQAAFGVHDGGSFSQRYSPGRQIAAAVVQHGHKMPVNFPKFFDVFKAACDDTGSGKGKKVEADTTDVEGAKTMESLSEVESVDPAELASPTFDVKAANKELEVNRTVEDAGGKSHLFVLLDVSGSMQETAVGGVTRAFAANAVSLALLKYAMDDKYKVWIVPFDDNVDRRNVKEAIDRKSALETMNWLGGLAYDGSGTSIQTAILYAYKMLNTDPKYKKCEVVLITDGACTISDRVVTEKPANCTFRTIFMTNVKNSMKHLSAISRTAVTLKWDAKQGRFDYGDAFVGLDQWDK